MKTIWKFPLKGDTAENVEMPKGARIVHVGFSGHAICLWAEVDTTAPREKRTFLILGTGMPHPITAQTYLDTVHTGPLAWHVYEAGLA